MTSDETHRLTATQLAALEASLHLGSANASQSLAKWIGKPSVVELDSLVQLPLAEATGLLSSDDEPICYCAAEMQGPVTGHLILAFDDSSGWALADNLLDQQPGSTVEWTEMAISAALETTNILCCAYSNSLARRLCVTDEPALLLPTPPRFSREFPESLLQFALMGQAVASDVVVVAQTRFEIDGTPVTWTLLFVPAAESLWRLPQLLDGANLPGEQG